MKEKPYLEKTEYELAVEGLKAAIAETKARNKKLEKNIKEKAKTIKTAKRKKKLTIEGFTKAKRD